MGTSDYSHRVIIMDVIGSISGAFSFASEALFGKWVRWIILIISSIIFPLIMGYTLRIMKGVTPAPEPEDYLGMFIDGIKMFIIGFVYMIIPCIIGVVIFSLSGGFGALTMLMMNVSKPGAYLGMLAGSFGISFLIFFILMFIFGLFEIIGMVQFARTGSMGAAFAFSEILERIGKIGWGSYLIALILLGVIFFIIYGILSLIPVIGWLLTLILMPYLSIVGARVYSLLYDAGQ